MAKIIQSADLTPDTPLTPFEAEHIYNGLDTCVTLEVLNALLPQLDNVSRNTYEFSKSLQAPVLEMSLRGLRVDQHRRDQVLTLFREQIAAVEANLDRIVTEGIGVELNWRSPAQLSDLFYNIMQLPAQKKRNAHGKFTATVNRDAIEKLTQYFHAEPICNHLLTLRELDKKRQFLETGIDSDGRMRCNFNIAGTNTGRLASALSDFGTGTNLQNVDRDLRSSFVADPGMKFANLDLEQGDARNVGAICWNLYAEQDEAFAGSYLNACESGDLHTSVCRMAWADLDWRDEPGWDRQVAEVLAYRQDSYRQLAKKLGHGTNYYGTPATMAKHTRVDKPIIEEFQRKYFSGFPCIGVFNHNDKTTDCWHNRVRWALRDDGQITSLLGRRRYFFGRHNDDETLRAAIAYEPQSLTADEIDTGLLRLWRANRVELLLQVHDSVLIQYPEEQENEIIPWAIEQLKVMIPLAKGREFSVPVEAKIGWNWGEWSETNPDGLQKWKGEDKRARSEPVREKLSLF